MHCLVDLESTRKSKEYASIILLLFLQGVP